VVSYLIVVSVLASVLDFHCTSVVGSVSRRIYATFGLRRVDLKLSIRTGV